MTTRTGLPEQVKSGKRMPKQDLKDRTAKTSITGGTGRMGHGEETRTDRTGHYSINERC
jgi:hypothetical protein